MTATPLVTALLAFLATTALGQHPTAPTPARPAPAQVLFDFEGPDARTDFGSQTKSVIGVRPAPEVAADLAPPDAATPRPAGTALRVQGFAKTFVHAQAKRMPHDLTQFAAVSLWVFRGEDEVEKHPQTDIELQLVEEEGVRFWRKLTLDHTGWRRIELPLRWLSPSGGRLPRWDRIATLGIYFRTPGELLFDAIALQPGDGAFLQPDVDIRPLAFGAATEATLHNGKDHWLLTDLENRGDELHELDTELTRLQQRVTAELGLEPGRERPGIVVFAKDADYRAFTPRLAARLDRKANAPTSDGFTVLGIATTSADAETGLRRPAIVHEFVHSVIERATQLPAVPDWFQEGIASYYQAQLRPQADLAARIARDYVDAESPPELRSFCSAKTRFRGEYVLAMTVAATLLAEPYRKQLPALIDAFRRAKSTDLEPHLGPVLGTDWGRFTAQWRTTCKQLAGR